MEDIIDDSSDDEFYSGLERQPYTQLLHFPSRYAGFFVSDLNVPVPLRTFRGSRNGYSWLNSDERKGKSSQAFISPSISKKIFAKQCRASPVTSLASLFVFVEKKKKKEKGKIKFSKTNIFYQDGWRISKRERRDS